MVGRLDLLINNAARFRGLVRDASGADLDAARTVMNVNLFGTWQWTQLLLPLLGTSPAPRIVNVSSGAGSHQDTDFGLAARRGPWPRPTASPRPP